MLATFVARVTRSDFDAAVSGFVPKISRIDKIFGAICSSFESSRLVCFSSIFLIQFITTTNQIHEQFDRKAFTQ